MFRNNRPDKVEVDAKILVNDYVAEGDDLLPRNFGVSLAQFIGNAAARFTE
ncbi:MAG: hypothetical protein ABI759_25080 [Candidatus Solibacter sp.]